MSHHLAQLNVARLVAPLDSPMLADFVAGLDPINALADRAEGFLWRLQDEEGNATGYRPFDDEMLIVNLSLWRSLSTLRAFVYQGEHVTIMRRRREWFEQMAEAYQVLWWVPAGHIPTVAEARARLDQLRAHGPTPHAFTFRETFPASVPDR